MVFKTTLLTALILAAAGSPALAATGLNAQWGAPTSNELDVVFTSEHALQKNLHEKGFDESLLLHALSDAENRVSSDFAVKKEMWNVVHFWLNIYTSHSTHDVVLFDARHPEVVYEVLSFTDLHKKSRNRMAYEIVRGREIEKKIKEYRNAFAGLLRNPRPRRPTATQKKILRAVRASTHRHSLSHYAKYFKTQTGQRDNVIRGIVESGPFVAGMREIFEGYGIPAELLQISLVESSFNYQATSRVGATGVWQFMEATGKEFMRVHPELGFDERLNPLKSTIAAAKLLKRNYRMLGNWPFAITAYNHGHGGLRELSRQATYRRNPEKAFALCQKRSVLGWASSNYYAEFLAMVHAYAYRDHFYKEVPPVVPMQVALAKLERRSSALDVVMKHAVSVTEFLKLNPDIMKLSAKLPEGFEVVLPSIAPAINGVQQDTKKAALEEESVRADDVHHSG